MIGCGERERRPISESFFSSISFGARCFVGDDLKTHSVLGGEIILFILYSLESSFVGFFQLHVCLDLALQSYI